MKWQISKARNRRSDPFDRTVQALARRIVKSAKNRDECDLLVRDVVALLQFHIVLDVLDMQGKETPRRRSQRKP